MRRRLEDLVEMRADSSQSLKETTLDRIKSAESSTHNMGTIAEEGRIKSGSSGKAHSPDRVRSGRGRARRSAIIEPVKDETMAMTKYELLVQKINPNKRKSVIDVKLEIVNEK
jgi:hypothetical protein